MSINRETQRKIENFARENALLYLEDAQMTYLEKLRRKSGDVKHKIRKKLMRFKPGSDGGREAQNDMILYMSDYINDLVSNGMPESEAFDKAANELKFSSEDSGINEHFKQQILDYSSKKYEAIGVLYGGFMFIGLVFGALTGYVLSGGRAEFLSGGWIDTIVGTCAGVVLGIGAGQICHALIVKKDI